MRFSFSSALNILINVAVGTESGVILGNILIYVAKWTIWKQVNKIE
jgi:hypothetical protein